MEGIMTDYADVYLMKRELTEESLQELSSLNNNFSLEENDQNIDPFPGLFDYSENKDSEVFQNTFSDNISELNIDLDKDQNWHLQNEVQSTGNSCSSWICVKCQKDIGNEPDACIKFWQKSNEQICCSPRKTCSNNISENLFEESNFKTLNFGFAETGSLEVSKNENQIEEIKNALSEIEEWANTLIDEDIEIFKPKNGTNTDEILEDLVPKNQTEIDDSEKNGISDSQPSSKVVTGSLATQPCGNKEYASLHSWSQHKAFYLALSGKVDDSTSKGTSETKEVNALSIRRSCFRALSSHYKQSFSNFNRAWQDKKRNKKKTKNMNEFIDIYIKQEFGDFLENMHEDFYKSFRAAVIAVLHSHRYKKKEEFTQDIDFSVIRDVLYSYTLDARERLICDPSYALIYHHFFVNGAYKFMNAQVQWKTKLYVFELEQELVDLHKDAIKTLH